MSDSTDRDSAAAEHQRAVQQFLLAARAVPASDWERSMTHEKWSPAQVAEHLRLTYVVVGQQLAGGAGIRVRAPWWLRFVLRRRILPRILSTGVFPVGARAPSELRPSAGPFEREPVLSALAVAANAAEAATARAWDNPSPSMTHHVFGGLRAPTALLLLTVHTAHHAGQLAPRAD